MMAIEPRGGGEPERITVPVFLDATRDVEGTSLARCSCFIVETEDPGTDLPLPLPGFEGTPFLIVGASAVVRGGAGGEPTFDRPEVVEALFQAVEERPEMSLQQSDLWLPSALLAGDREAAGPERGDVFRVRVDLFRLARRYTAQHLSLDSFLQEAETLREAVRPSPEETEVFRSWNRAQIEEAIRIYPKSEALELGWREPEEEG